MLRAKDVLYISRTHCEGLGLSVLRDGELIAAAGAVMHVPLGPPVNVRYPHELVEEAEAVFRARDPEYDTWNYPAQLRVGTAVLCRAVTFVTAQIDRDRMEVSWSFPETADRDRMPSSRKPRTN